MRGDVMSSPSNCGTRSPWLCRSHVSGGKDLSDTVSTTTAAEPDGAPRIAVLDILRGIAILGILFMNINDMGQSLHASFDDIRHLGWSASDRIAWWLREVLASGTARCLLEMLFGAGMVILTGRAAQRAGEWVVLRRYYARNLMLSAFGLVHVFILLWPGDILHTYGLAALVAVLFRRLDARWLMTIGLIAAVMQVVGGGLNVATVRDNQAAYAQVLARQQARQPLTGADKAVLEVQDEYARSRAKNEKESQDIIAREDKARSGTFMTWARFQWYSFIHIQQDFLELLFVWEAASVMLLGAALFKLGVLQGGRSRRFYGWMTLAGYGVAVPLRIWGAVAMTAPEGTGPHVAPIFYEVAREAMTLGHVGLINLLVTSAFGAKLLRPFGAAGRTALSVYIAQTLICLWVLYPPFVLGLYGEMTWGPLMVTAFAVDACLLTGANLWVRRFDIAPVEWAWRSLIEGRVLPWRGRPRVASVPDAAPVPA